MLFVSNANMTETVDETMQDFILALNNLRLSLAETNITLPHEVIAMSEIMIKFGVPTMTDGHEEEFASMYNYARYLTKNERVKSALKKLKQSHNRWTYRFMDEYFKDLHQ